MSLLTVRPDFVGPREQENATFPVISRFGHGVNRVLRKPGSKSEFLENYFKAKKGEIIVDETGNSWLILELNDKKIMISARAHISSIDEAGKFALKHGFTYPDVATLKQIVGQVNWKDQDGAVGTSTPYDNDSGWILSTDGSLEMAVSKNSPKVIRQRKGGWNYLDGKKIQNIFTREVE